ncbi:hypothetical protein [Streptomyces sp. NPDC001717]|uniref:hypothetical protein n=1 Tax=Streptomyces sp. NPDC001717 TaxID=3364604 RepID=UPI0036B817DE
MDRTAGGVRIDARSFGHLRLEHFGQLDPVLGDDHRLQAVAGVDEHDSGCVHAGEAYAVFDQAAQEREGVHVVGDGIGEADECLGDRLLAVHVRRHPSRAG